MSIIHTLIARYPDIVLCEYAEHSGNFLQVTRVILQKISNVDGSKSITYDNHKFVYIYENGLIYLCLTEQMKDKVAFAFLTDIKRRLLQTYNYDSLTTYKSFQLNEFTDVLRQFMVC